MELALFVARLLANIVIYNIVCSIPDTNEEVVTSTAEARQNLINKLMPSRILWYNNTRSPYLCLADCARDEICHSFVYSQQSGHCVGYSITFGSTEGSVEVPDTRYYVLQRGLAYIGDKCVAVSDCVTINTECRDGLCMCIPGYSFSPRTGECLDVCTAYGSDFLEVRDHFISAQNYEVISNVTLPACFALCLSRIEYDCLSLEYGRSSGDCYLANITVLHWPDRWHLDSDKDYNISYYQRDCD